MRRKVLAIDLGTSGPKVAVIDSEGRLLATGFAPTGVRLLEDGGAEQDPDEWWNAIGMAAKKNRRDGGSNSAR